MNEEEVVYKSFLIRIRCNQLNQVQRVMVTCVNADSEQYNFSTLDDLMIFLLHELNNSLQEDKQ